MAPAATSSAWNWIPGHGYTGGGGTERAERKVSTALRIERRQSRRKSEAGSKEVASIESSTTTVVLLRLQWHCGAACIIPCGPGTLAGHPRTPSSDAPVRTTIGGGASDAISKIARMRPREGRPSLGPPPCVQGARLR